MMRHDITVDIVWQDLTCVSSAGVSTTPQRGLISSSATPKTPPVSTVDILSKWTLEILIYMCGCIQSSCIFNSADGALDFFLSLAYRS